jgi:hypothetical protein
MTHSELGNQPPLTVLVNKVRGNYSRCGESQPEKNESSSRIVMSYDGH